MSLINDALKQAGRAPRPVLAANSDAPAGANLRPVDDARPSRGSSVFLPVLLVVILATAGWCFKVWWKTRLNPGGFNFVTLIESTKSLIPGKKPGAESKPGTTSANSSTPAAASGATGAATAKLEGGKAEGNFLTRAFNKQPPATPGKPASFPSMKVQGIYYRVGDSTVLINGKNLTEGEEIDGVKIAKIDRQTVTLEFQGETKEIKLR